MQYLLFLDTEASDMPRKWEAPNSEPQAWPHIVQLSWVVYTQAGKELKRENMYISDHSFSSTPSAVNIHGITDDFRNQHGVDRKSVMARLIEDLIFFRPLLVCHFIELDIRLLEVELFRAGIAHDLRTYRPFCTMEASRALSRDHRKRALRLEELYGALFYKKLENHHDALTDALATATCFFELYKKGFIDDDSIRQQHVRMEKVRERSARSGFIALISTIFCLTVLIVSAKWIVSNF